MEDQECCIATCYYHVHTYQLRHNLSHPRVAVQCLEEQTSSRLHKRKSPEPQMRTYQLQEFYQSTGYPELAERDTGTGTAQDSYQVDGPGSEGEVEDHNMVEGEATDGLPLRQSQRLRRPPLRMTYDVMGQPSFQPNSIAGIQGITASYPQQLWQPVTVPWMLQPSMHPYSYFVLSPVSVQPMYPTWCY